MVRDIVRLQRRTRRDRVEVEAMLGFERARHGDLSALHSAHLARDHDMNQPSRLFERHRVTGHAPEQGSRGRGEYKSRSDIGMTSERDFVGWREDAHPRRVDGIGRWEDDVDSE